MSKYKAMAQKQKDKQEAMLTEAPKPVSTESSEPIESNVNIDSSVTNESNEVTKPSKAPLPKRGSKAGLQPGWSRATVIVRDDQMNTLRDYAYTHRTSVKDLLEDALTKYIGGLDLTGLLHKEK